MPALAQATAPTQRLRDTIANTRYGIADADDLDNALLELENLLGLTLTTATED